MSTPDAQFYLASQSPRRQELLKLWQIPYQLLPPLDTQSAELLEQPLNNELPIDYVERVTRLKWSSAMERIKQERLTPMPVLVADTTVALNARILGKPNSTEQALLMLSALSGRRHQVHTCVALGDMYRMECVIQTSEVIFSDIDMADIQRYIASHEPFGKAGAYGIQGTAGLWIQSIQGSYTGIMGLPAYETRQLLRQFHIPTPV